MSMEKLKKLWSGEPLFPVRNFEKFELQLGGELPQEYKRLLEVFGLGSFGELRLFHPDRSRLSLRLPDAVFEARELLRSLGEQYDLEKFHQIAESSFVLGEIGARRYLLWDKSVKEWIVWDTEMDRKTRIGYSLAEFLLRAYDAVLRKDEGDESWQVGSVMWSGDETPPLFSVPQQGRF